VSISRVPAPRRSAGRRNQSWEGARRCRRKFLHFFPEGFRDSTYLDWERDYKAEAHRQWNDLLAPALYQGFLRQKAYAEIAQRAVRVESRTNLLFSFEKMALRDAVKSAEGARSFSVGLHEFLHGPGSDEEKFSQWCSCVAGLPRKQTRVLTWPLVTVWGFLAQPDAHVFLKPKVTRIAAQEYGFPFDYESTPNWRTYESLRRFVAAVRRDLRDLRPRDMIDLQSFLWVQGSEEYEE
jgi:hypothetical protein